MRCFTSVWVALTVTWSGGISSGCLVDCLGLLAGSIGLMCSIIRYAVLHFGLGCIDGYLVGSDILGLFGRFFRALSWFKCTIACTMAYEVIYFSLGCIDGYLVRSDIVRSFGRLFRALGGLNRSYLLYYTICSASFPSGMDWWLLGRVRYLQVVWSILSGCQVIQ